MNPYLAIGTALASLGVGYLNKPRKKDYTPDTSYLDKYVANLRSDLASRRVERNILREGSRAIGDLSREQMEQAEYQAHRTGTVGTGLQIAQQQKIGQQAQSTMAEVTRVAKQAQAEETARTQDAINQIEMKKEMVNTQAREDYRRAKGAWGRDMIGRSISGAVKVGGAFAQSAMAWKDAGAIATAQGITDEEGNPLSIRELKEMTGASTPSGVMQALNISQDRKKSANFVKSIVDTMGLNADITREWIDRMNNNEITPQQALQGIEKTEEFQYNNAAATRLSEVIDSFEEGNPVNTTLSQEVSRFVAQGFSTQDALSLAKQVMQQINTGQAEEIAKMRIEEGLSILKDERISLSPESIAKEIEHNPVKGIELALRHNQQKQQELARADKEKKEYLIEKGKFDMGEVAQSGRLNAEDFYNAYSADAQLYGMTQAEFNTMVNTSQTRYKQKQKQKRDTIIAMTSFGDFGKTMEWLSSAVKETQTHQYPDRNTELLEVVFEQKLSDVVDKINSGISDPEEIASISNELYELVDLLSDDTVREIMQGYDINSLITRGLTHDEAAILSSRQLPANYKFELFRILNKRWTEFAKKGIVVSEKSVINLEEYE